MPTGRPAVGIFATGPMGGLTILPYSGAFSRLTGTMREEVLIIKRKRTMTMGTERTITIIGVAISVATRPIRAVEAEVTPVPIELAAVERLAIGEQLQEPPTAPRTAQLVLRSKSNLPLLWQ